MGAKVSGHGSGTITIEGVKNLKSANYTPIGDRIECRYIHHDRSYDE